MRMRMADIAGIGLLCSLAMTGAEAATVEWTELPVITDTAFSQTITPRLSPQVQIKYIGISSSYAIGARSLQGSRTYAVNNQYMGIFMKEGLTHDFTAASEAFAGWGKVSE